MDVKKWITHEDWLSNGGTVHTIHGFDNETQALQYANRRIGRAHEITLRQNCYESDEVCLDEANYPNMLNVCIYVNGNYDERVHIWVEHIDD